jgi:hypothetical protein
LCFFCAFLLHSKGYGEERKPLPPQAVAALETFAAHLDKLQDPTDLVMFHGRMGGLHAIHGKDSQPHFSAALKALGEVKAEERPWYSYDLVEGFAFADQPQAVVNLIKPFPLSEQLALLGCAAQSYTQQQKAIPDTMTKAFAASVAAYTAQIGKADPEMPEADDSELVTKAQIMEAQHDWIVALSMLEDATLATKAIAEVSKDSTPEFLGGLVAEAACQRLWRDPNDMLGLAWLETAKRQLLKDGEPSVKGEEFFPSSAYSSLAAAAAYAHDAALLSKIEAVVKADSDDQSPYRFLIADRIRVARRSEDSKQIPVLFNLGLISLTTEAFAAGEDYGWLEWDMVELTRSLGDAPIPKGTRDLFAGLPVLQQSFDYGQARYWVVPQTP